MLELPVIREYVLGLPAPCPYNYYIDWLGIQLKNGLKIEVSVGTAAEKKAVLN